jgi:CAAX protease family protein
VLKFFALTYTLTWTCWLGALWFAGDSRASMPAFSELRGPLLFVGSFCPALAALWLTAREDGRAATRALLNRMFESNVAGRWYLFAVGYGVAVRFAAALLYHLVAGSWPTFGTEPWFGIVAAIVVSTPIVAGEEIGWRGYALPRLAARYGLGGASLILGAVHACWHLPLFVVPGHVLYGQSFPAYVILGIALSVAFGWLYAHTRGSLLLAMLMHSPGIRRPSSSRRKSRTRGILSCWILS